MKAALKCNQIQVRLLSKFIFIIQAAAMMITASLLMLQCFMQHLLHALEQLALAVKQRTIQRPKDPLEFFKCNFNNQSAEVQKFFAVHVASSILGDNFLIGLMRLTNFLKMFYLCLFASMCSFMLWLCIRNERRSSLAAFCARKEKLFSV